MKNCLIITMTIVSLLLSAYFTIDCLADPPKDFIVKMFKNHYAKDGHITDVYIQYGDALKGPVPTDVGYVTKIFWPAKATIIKKCKKGSMRKGFSGIMVFQDNYGQWDYNFHELTSLGSFDDCPEVKVAKEKAEAKEKEKEAEDIRKTIEAAKMTQERYEKRFITQDNGTVTDTKTGLTWATSDNGSDINWMDAKNYCENYRLAGFTDWRMPTNEELASLYNESLDGYQQRCCVGCGNIKTSNHIQLSCAIIWSSDIQGSEASSFAFASGNQVWDDQRSKKRALPVRVIK